MYSFVECFELYFAHERFTDRYGPHRRKGPSAVAQEGRRQTTVRPGALFEQNGHGPFQEGDSAGELKRH